MPNKQAHVLISAWTLLKTHVGQDCAATLRSVKRELVHSFVGLRLSECGDSLVHVVH